MSARPRGGASPSIGPATTTTRTTTCPAAHPPAAPKRPLDCACSLYLSDPSIWTLDPRRFNGGDHYRRPPGHVAVAPDRTEPSSPRLGRRPERDEPNRPRAHVTTIVGWTGSHPFIFARWGETPRGARVMGQQSEPCRMRRRSVMPDRRYEVRVTGRLSQRARDAIVGLHVDEVTTETVIP